MSDWRIDSEGTEYLGYQNMILVVYHVVNDLFNWHVEGKVNGRRVCWGHGSSFGKDTAKKDAKIFADEFKTT